jgi:hypothetical protein
MSRNEEALRQAHIGAQAWREAVHAQQVARAHHADFYALAAAMVETLGAVESLALVLIRQVDGYVDSQADGEHVYDDTRVVDPRVRLDAAADFLRVLIGRVSAASAAVNEFWSAIGHIGVEEVSP